MPITPYMNTQVLTPDGQSFNPALIAVLEIDDVCFGRQLRAANAYSVTAHRLDEEDTLDAEEDWNESFDERFEEDFDEIDHEL